MKNVASVAAVLGHVDELLLKAHSDAEEILSDGLGFWNISDDDKAYLRDVLDLTEKLIDLLENW